MSVPLSVWLLPCLSVCCLSVLRSVCLSVCCLSVLRSVCCLLSVCPRLSDCYLVWQSVCLSYGLLECWSKELVTWSRFNFVFSIKLQTQFTWCEESTKTIGIGSYRASYRLDWVPFAQGTLINSRSQWLISDLIKWCKLIKSLNLSSHPRCLAALSWSLTLCQARDRIGSSPQNWLIISGSAVSRIWTAMSGSISVVARKRSTPGGPLSVRGQCQ